MDSVGNVTNIPNPPHQFASLMDSVGIEPTAFPALEYICEGNALVPMSYEPLHIFVGLLA